MIKLKDHGESHPVDILHAKDFYARMKAAGVRKASKEDDNLNKFLRLDAKFPHLMQIKKVVKALEEVAQVEQKKMQEEMAVIASKEGIIEEQQNETSDEEEPELQGDKKKKVRKAKKQPLKAGKGGKAATNLDLMREAGMGGNGYGYMNDYFAGANKIGGPAVSQKMALLMGGGFSHLNTIEEEKHETQTSNYFREAGGNATESERDYDAIHMRGSHILDDDLINSTGKYSPNRHAESEFDFPGSAKNSGLNQKGSLGAMIPLITPNSTKQTKNKKLNDRLVEGLLLHDEVKPIEIEEDEDHDEEDDEEYTHQEEDEYEEDDEVVEKKDSDYEF